MGVAATPESVQAIIRIAHQAMLPLDGDAEWLEDYNDGAVPIRRFLYSLCRWAKVRVAIELGIAKGCSTLHLAAGASDAVIGVDLAPDWNAVRSNQLVWDKRWPGKVTVIYGNSVADAMVAEVESILDGLEAQVDLLYIDSLHEAAHASREWELYRHFLAPGAMVAMDDVVDPPEMQAVYQAIPGEHVDLNWLHEVYRPGPGPQTVGFGLIITRE